MLSKKEKQFLTVYIILLIVLSVIFFGSIKSCEGAPSEVWGGAVLYPESTGGPTLATTLIVPDNGASPGKIYWLSIGSSSMTLTNTLTLNTGEVNLAWLIVSGNFAYTCTAQNPIQVIKIDLVNHVRVGKLVLAANEAYCDGLSISNGFLYVGFQPQVLNNQRITKINLTTFTEVGTLGFFNNGGGTADSDMGISNGILYVSTGQSGVNPDLAAINLGTYTVSATANANAGTVGCGYSNYRMVPQGSYAYVPCANIADIIRVVESPFAFSGLSSDALALSSLSQTKFIEADDMGNLYVSDVISSNNGRIGQVKASSFSVSGYLTPSHHGQGYAPNPSRFGRTSAGPWLFTGSANGSQGSSPSGITMINLTTFSETSFLSITGSSSGLGGFDVYPRADQQ